MGDEKPLTVACLRILRSASGPHGVIGVPPWPGFGGASRKRHIARLVAKGLIERSAYGDYYITDAGRGVLAKEADRG